MTYTRIDRDIATKIAQEVEAVLKKYGQEVGLEYSREGRGKFTESDFSLKINLKLAGGKTFAEKCADEDFDYVMNMHNLTNEARTVSGMDLMLVGYNSRKWKKPFIVRQVGTNNEFVLTEFQARTFFKKAA